ncbi:MAG TPA: hypothetical protein VNF74_06805 [Terriglobales bacterium]|nr:hypothetical protein [Terriglobales bacterium]
MLPGSRPRCPEYLAQIVLPTLERQKRLGAVALKFEAAYLRPLNFHRPDAARAERVYARYAAPGAGAAAPDPADDYALQDAIFHFIALQAGRLRLAVHFHTGFGCGSYFDLAGANPLLLEDVFNDPSLRGTNFVLLHGGVGPYGKIVASLVAKPNVYADYSGQTWALPTAEVAQVVRYWLEWYPEKVMFGTDASPGAVGQDWEETAWQTSQSARAALALALTGMVRDQEIPRARALEIARMVLRGNALRLYHWPDR